MRLDKWLKNARIIKRRTVAKEAVESEKVFINGKQAKPSSAVKIGDKLEIHFGEKIVAVEIMEIIDKPSKEASKTMYKIIE